jgi:hypothetical protein
MNRTVRYLFLPCLLTSSFAAWGVETDCATPAGAGVTDGPVSAQAAFTSGNGSITITLTNLLADPTSAGQLLSGLAFTVSEGETSGILGANAANIRTVNQDRTFTDFGPSGTGWALAQNFDGGLELCVLCRDLGSLGPSHLLIGPPATSGTYASANRSIAGNGPHNPLTAGTATFLVNVPGVTPNSTIPSATFFFSTTEGVSVGGSCSANGGGSGPPQ